MALGVFYARYINRFYVKFHTKNNLDFRWNSFSFLILRIYKICIFVLFLDGLYLVKSIYSILYFNIENLFLIYFLLNNEIKSSFILNISIFILDKFINLYLNLLIRAKLFLLKARNSILKNCIKINNNLERKYLITSIYFQSNV